METVKFRGWLIEQVGEFEAKATRTKTGKIAKFIGRNPIWQAKIGIVCEELLVMSRGAALVNSRTGKIICHNQFFLTDNPQIIGISPVTDEVSILFLGKGEQIEKYPARIG